MKAYLYGETKNNYQLKSLKAFGLKHFQLAKFKEGIYISYEQFDSIEEAAEKLKSIHEHLLLSLDFNADSYKFNDSVYIVNGPSMIVLYFGIAKELEDEI